MTSAVPAVVHLVQPERTSQDLLQEIDDILLQPENALHPEAANYFPGTAYPQCSYAFWTQHARNCVTGHHRSQAPDPTLAEAGVEWSWFGPSPE